MTSPSVCVFNKPWHNLMQIGFQIGVQRTTGFGLPVSCSLENENSCLLTIGTVRETSGARKRVSVIEDVVVVDDCCSTQ
jgi:hypothetical protein